MRAIVLDSTNGLIYVGGDFTTVNGATTRNRLAALSTSTGTATAWNPNMNNLVSLVRASTARTVSLYTWGLHDGERRTTRNRLAGLSTSTATSTAWNPNMGNLVYSLALDTGQQSRVRVGHVHDP